MMKKLILSLFLSICLFSCTKIDKDRSGPILNKGMASDGSIWIVVRLNAGDVEMTVWAPTVYNPNPTVVYNSYKIGEIYCKP